MNDETLTSIVGWDFRSIIVDQLTVSQQEDGYNYLASEPVLYFRSREKSNTTMCWVLAWDETNDGDNRLVMNQTQNRETLPCFERIEGFTEPVLIGSTIQFENNRIRSVTVHGYRDERIEFVTGLSFLLNHEYVTFYCGPVYTIKITDSLPEDVDSTLYSVGESI